MSNLRIRISKINGTRFVTNVRQKRTHIRAYRGNNLALAYQHGIAQSAAAATTSLSDVASAAANAANFSFTMLAPQPAYDIYSFQPAATDKRAPRRTISKKKPKPAKVKATAVIVKKRPAAQAEAAPPQRRFDFKPVSFLVTNKRFVKK